MAKGKAMIDIWWGELGRHQPKGFAIYRLSNQVWACPKEFEEDHDIIRKAEYWARGQTFTPDQVRVLKWYQPRLMEVVEVTEPAP